MFEDLFEEIRKREAVIFPQVTVVFLHYGVVRGIEYILRETTKETGKKTLETSHVKTVMSKEIGLLEKKLKQSIEESGERKELYRLIIFVARGVDVKLTSETQKYINKLVNSSVHVVVADGARLAKGDGREEVEPEDLDESCHRTFESKWFVC